VLQPELHSLLKSLLPSPFPPCSWEESSSGHDPLPSEWNPTPNTSAQACTMPAQQASRASLPVLSPAPCTSGSAMVSSSSHRPSGRSSWCQHSAALLVSLEDTGVSRFSFTPGLPCLVTWQLLAESSRMVLGL
jgi:hypothetical protein